MRILRLVRSMDPAAGGVTEAIRSMAVASARQGHVVEVASLDAPDASFLRDFPFRVHALGPAWLGYGYSPRLVPWLKAHARDFDVVIVDGLWQYHGLAAWRVLRKGPVPYVVMPHGMLDPWFRRNYPLKHLKKLAYWSLVERQLFSSARAIVYSCEEERARGSHSFPGYVARDQVALLGIDAGGAGWARQDLAEEFFSRRPALDQKRLLLFLGRLVSIKGCDDLLRGFACEASHNASLHLVMAGPDQDGWCADLQELARALGVEDRITWTGMLRGREKWSAVMAAEALIAPSHHESFGLAVVEALACGKPVLISDKVNIWREITQDGAGFAADDSEDGVRELLRRWVALTSVERESMAHQATECFNRRFEIDGAVRELTAMLAVVVSGKPSA